MVGRNGMKKYHHPCAVHIIIVCGNDIGFARTKKHGLDFIVSGCVRAEESMVEGAIRECREEVGLDITESDLVILRTCLPPRFYGWGTLYCLRIASKTILKPEDNIWKLEWIPVDTLFSTGLINLPMKSDLRVFLENEDPVFDLIDVIKKVPQYVYVRRDWPESKKKYKGGWPIIFHGSAIDSDLSSYSRELFGLYQKKLFLLCEAFAILLDRFFGSSTLKMDPMYLRICLVDESVGTCNPTWSVDTNKKYAIYGKAIFQLEVVKRLFEPQHSLSAVRLYKMLTSIISNVNVCNIADQIGLTSNNILMGQSWDDSRLSNPKIAAVIFSLFYVLKERESPLLNILIERAMNLGGV